MNNWIESGRLDPDLQVCFDYLEATKKFVDLCNSSNISKMVSFFVALVAYLTLSLLDQTNSDLT